MVFSVTMEGATTQKTIQCKISVSSVKYQAVDVAAAVETEEQEVSSQLRW